MVRGTDNGRQKTRNHGYDDVESGGSYLLITRSPRKLVTQTQSADQQAPDATSFFPVVDLLPQTACAERLLSEKSGRCGIAAVERGALPMIDRGDIRQAIDPLQQYLGFTAGRSGQFKRGDGLIAKFKEAGGTVREIDV